MRVIYSENEEAAASSASMLGTPMGCSVLCYIKLQRELKVVIEVNSHFLDGAKTYKQLSYTRDLRHHTVGHVLSFSTEQ